jgi:uncharacterized protein YndB with AHSA1/START domain/GNAT superfamily N-acetyltransferase
MPVLATVWYLELPSPEALRAAPPVDAEIAVAGGDARLNRWLYEDVGGGYDWVDHLNRDDAWWERRDKTRTTLLALSVGEPAGYAELAPQPDGTVDLDYFGLRPGFPGRGLGGHLLTTAVRHAFGPLQARRVTVNTCSLDHRAALSNYRKRGFEIVREREQRRLTRADLAPRVAVSTTIAAPPPAIWRAMMRERAAWWPQLTELDEHAGGRFEEHWSDGRRARRTGGSVLTVDPARHLALDWADEDWPASTRVTLDVIPTVAGGATVVAVRQTGWDALPDPAALAGAHAAGWAEHLQALRVHLASAGIPAP